MSRDIPGEDWQLDFTQMPSTTQSKFLLLFVDTFTRWIEAFPTQKEKFTEVARKLLHEIIPRFGPPLFIQSDNGPAFTASIVQNVFKAPGIKYCLHCSW